MILSKLKSISFLLLISALLASCGNNKKVEVSPLPQHEYTKNEFLLSPNDLSKLIEKQADFALIDCRKAEQWAESHIENAINIYRSEMTQTIDTVSGLALDRDQVAKILGQKGVKTGQDIILYDDRAQCESVRFWWLLTSYGHKNVKILDGGFQDWQAHGFTLETDIDSASAAPVEFKFTKDADTNNWANIEMVKRAIESENIAILDCRSKAEYTGEELKKGAFRAGHIPSAIHFDFWENMNMGSDGEIWFRTKEEVAEKYASLGFNKKDTIVVYCQSGVRSAQTSFVLTELLGYKNVYNYDGSWIQWSANPNLPIINEFETPKQSERDPGEVI
jgi:thiosulfate/3-mercaptopyruvate sulfurtransferase